MNLIRLRLNAIPNYSYHICGFNLFFLVITVVLMLMNKRFLFDRLSGTYYTSTVQNGQTTEIDIVEATAETEKKTFKSIRCDLKNRQGRTRGPTDESESPLPLYRL